MGKNSKNYDIRKGQPDFEGEHCSKGKVRVFLKPFYPHCAPNEYVDIDEKIAAELFRQADTTYHQWDNERRSSARHKQSSMDTTGVECEGSQHVRDKIESSITERPAAVEDIWENPFAYQTYQCIHCLLTSLSEKERHRVYERFWGGKTVIKVKKFKNDETVTVVHELKTFAGIATAEGVSISSVSESVRLALQKMETLAKSCTHFEMRSHGNPCPRDKRQV